MRVVLPFVLVLTPVSLAGLDVGLRLSTRVVVRSADYPAAYDVGVSHDPDPRLRDEDDESSTCGPRGALCI